jgi:hypothetical protein
MKLITALTYWVIVALWAAVLVTLIVSYLRESRRFEPMRLLLIVLGIDILRNLIENSYFGMFFGAEYGLFPLAMFDRRVEGKRMICGSGGEKTGSRRRTPDSRTREFVIGEVVEMTYVS